MAESAYALVLETKCYRFDPCLGYSNIGRLAQMERASVLHTEGRRFKSYTGYLGEDMEEKIMDRSYESHVTTTGGVLHHHDHDPLCKTCRSLPIGSEGCTCEELWKLRYRAEELVNGVDAANVILTRVHPGCPPMNNLMGILIQLDQDIAVQSDWAAEKEGLEEKIREQQLKYDGYIKDRQAQFSKDQPV